MSAPVNDACVRRILVCQLRQIGDVLLATPSIQLLHRRFPEAEIHVFTEKSAAPMLFHNPHVQRIIELDKKKLGNFFQELHFYWSACRQGHYDLVVDFQQLPRCRWMVAFSGAPIRLSYTAPFYTRYLYTHMSPMRECYAAAKKASILLPLGIRWQGELPKLYLTEAERAAAAKLLKDGGYDEGDCLVTVDPSHRRETRRWPLHHFIRLLHMAAESWKDIRFLVLYGPGEEELAQKILHSGLPSSRFIHPSRMLTLREMAACQEKAALHFGNCSAPRHIAAAVGTKTLTVLGSTDSNWTCPGGRHRDIASGMDCQPCKKNVCSKKQICLERLVPETVFPLFAQMLGKA